MSTVEQDNRRASWAAMIVAAVMIGQNLAGKALRDGFFLSHFDASALPLVMTTTSLLSVAMVFGSVALFRRVSPSRSLPIVFTISALLFVAEWALSLRAPRAAAVLLYLHTTSVGAVVVSAFWSVVNERFDPHTAKQMIGKIAGGATLGGVIGGVAVWQGASQLSIPTMICVLGALNLGCALGVPAIGRPAIVRRDDDGPASSAFTIFEETPYLRQLALLVGLSAFSGAAFDYVLKARAATQLTEDGALVGFFALFYLGVGVATFVAQNLLTRRSLEKLGLAFNVGTLPAAACLFGPIAIMFPAVWAAVLLRGGTNVLESSLYRSGYELLYTPVAPEKKRPTKVLIDVGGDKLGAAIGGGAAFFVLGIFPVFAEPLLLCIGVGAAVAALFVTRDLHQGYIASLAESLRGDLLDPTALDALDATTKAAVAHTMAAVSRSDVRADISRGGGNGAARLDRTAIRARLERAAGTRSDDGAPPAPGARSRAERSSSRTLEPTDVDGILIAIADLRSGDPERIEGSLRRHNPLPDVLVSHAIDLLADERVAATATPAIRKVAPANTGLLLDALLRTRAPLAVRREVCDILGALPTQRCAEGLVGVLDDRDFEFRFRAASGLLQIVQASSKVKVPEAPLFAAARTEARDSSRRWRYQTVVAERLGREAGVGSSAGLRVVHGLAYVFSLLFVVLDREPLRLAIRAVAAEDPAQRGTGLEYLHNVLPPDLREALWPLVDDRRLAAATLRDTSAMLAELVGQGAPRAVDLAALRERIRAQRDAAKHDPANR